MFEPVPSRLACSRTCSWFRAGPPSVTRTNKNCVENYVSANPYRPYDVGHAAVPQREPSGRVGVLQGENWNLCVRLDQRRRELQGTRTAASTPSPLLRGSVSPPSGHLGSAAQLQYGVFGGQADQQPKRLGVLERRRPGQFVPRLDAAGVVGRSLRRAPANTTRTPACSRVPPTTEDLKNGQAYATMVLNHIRPKPASVGQHGRLPGLG